MDTINNSIKKIKKLKNLTTANLIKETFGLKVVVTEDSIFTFINKYGNKLTYENFKYKHLQVPIMLSFFEIFSKFDFGNDFVSKMNFINIVDNVFNGHNLLPTKPDTITDKYVEYVLAISDQIKQQKYNIFMKQHNHTNMSIIKQINMLEKIDHYQKIIFLQQVYSLTMNKGIETKELELEKMMERNNYIFTNKFGNKLTFINFNYNLLDDINWLTFMTYFSIYDFYSDITCNQYYAVINDFCISLVICRDDTLNNNCTDKSCKSFDLAFVTYDKLYNYHYIKRENAHFIIIAQKYISEGSYRNPQPITIASIEKLLEYLESRVSFKIKQTMNSIKLLLGDELDYKTPKYVIDYDVRFGNFDTTTIVNKNYVIDNIITMIEQVIPLDEKIEFTTNIMETLQSYLVGLHSSVSNTESMNNIPVGVASVSTDIDPFVTDIDPFVINDENNKCNDSENID